MSDAPDKPIEFRPYRGPTGEWFIVSRGAFPSIAEAEAAAARATAACATTTDEADKGGDLAAG